MNEKGKLEWAVLSRVKTVAISDTKGSTIQPILKQVVNQDATLMTDEWVAYSGLNSEYDHHVVDHGKKQYANGIAHTNNIEGFWNWIKRMIMGVYHVVSRKHLQRYADEATFRFNTRGMSVGERIAYLLSLNRGSLKYRQLIGKFD